MAVSPRFCRLRVIIIIIIILKRIGGSGIPDEKGNEHFVPQATCIKTT